MRAAVLSAVPPLRPDEPTARRWLEDELAGPAYRSSSWLPDWNGPDAGDWSVPGGPWTLIVLALVIAAVVMLIVLGSPRARLRVAPAGSGVFTDEDLTSEAYRARALGHTGDGRWTTAYLDMFRALVKGLQERVVLDTRPGMTADEAARESAVCFPGQAARLRETALLFDRIAYGAGSATEPDFDDLAALEEQVRRARPHLFAATVPFAPAAPR